MLGARPRAPLSGTAPSSGGAKCLPACKHMTQRREDDRTSYLPTLAAVFLTGTQRREDDSIFLHASLKKSSYMRARHATKGKMTVPAMFLHASTSRKERKDDGAGYVPACEQVTQGKER